MKGEAPSSKIGSVVPIKTMLVLNPFTFLSSEDGECPCFEGTVSLLCRSVATSVKVHLVSLLFDDANFLQTSDDKLIPCLCPADLIDILTQKNSQQMCKMTKESQCLVAPWRALQ